MEVIGGVKQVVEAAEVFITATTAREPIVRGEWLRPGQHVPRLEPASMQRCLVKLIQSQATGQNG